MTTEHPEPGQRVELLIEQVAGLRQLAELQRHPRLRRPWVRVAAFLALFLTPVVLAVISVLIFPRQPVEQLLTAEPLPPRDRGVAVTITLRQLDADAGELLGDVTFTPTEGTANRGVLREPVTLRVVDAGGVSTFAFDQGEVMQGSQVRLRFTGSSATLYPFDTYRADLLVGATYGPADRAVPMPARLHLEAAFTQYRAAADARPSVLAGGSAARLEVERSLGVMAWAVMYMVIAWSLGLACLGLAWSSLTHFDTIPFWHWGLFASVLFALPTIRNNLPGDPPFGSVVDWGAHYWAVVMTAGALLLLVLTWLVTVRRGTARL